MNESMGPQNLSQTDMKFVETTSTTAGTHAMMEILLMEMAAAQHVLLKQGIYA
jgi:hypothetical protein